MHASALGMLELCMLLVAIHSDLAGTEQGGNSKHLFWDSIIRETSGRTCTHVHKCKVQQNEKTMRLRYYIDVKGRVGIGLGHIQGMGT